MTDSKRRADTKEAFRLELDRLVGAVSTVLPHEEVLEILNDFCEAERGSIIRNNIRKIE